MTSVVNIRKANLKEEGYDDLENWLEDPNHIYIGREMSFYVTGANASKWQNPFTKSKYGDDALRRYEEYLRANKKLMSEIKELKGKKLGCWCVGESEIPAQSPCCHGEILIKVLNEQR